MKTLTGIKSSTVSIRSLSVMPQALPLHELWTEQSFEYKGIGLVADFAGGTMQTFIRNNELKIPFANNGDSPFWLLEDRWHRADPFDPNSAWIAGTNPDQKRPYHTFQFQQNQRLLSYQRKLFAPEKPGDWIYCSSQVFTKVGIAKLECTPTCQTSYRSTTLVRSSISIRNYKYKRTGLSQQGV